MHNNKVNESQRFAHSVQQHMCKSLKSKYSSIRDRGVRKAPFYVLLGAEMPAILVETSFISNKRECKRLTSDAYQDKLVQGIVQGVKEYVKTAQSDHDGLDRIAIKEFGITPCRRPLFPSWDFPTPARPP